MYVCMMLFRHDAILLLHTALLQLPLRLLHLRAFVGVRFVHDLPSALIRSHFPSALSSKLRAGSIVNSPPRPPLPPFLSRSHETYKVWNSLVVTWMWWSVVSMA